MSAPRPALRALATRLGIFASYRDVAGRDQATSDATREALLAAMGHEARDEASAERILADLDRKSAARLVEPVLVWREWEHASPCLEVEPRAVGDAVHYRLELELESGERLSCDGALPGCEPGRERLSLALPCHPATGDHRLRLEIDGASGTRRAEQRLVMAPRTAFQPEEALGPRRATGIWANLYTLRGARDTGHGHLGDLADLVRAAGKAGVDFVGVNPLHAVTNRGLDFAPYSPVSRLYRNVLYIDPYAVPELAGCAEESAQLAEIARRQSRSLGREICHEAVLAALLPLLRSLHARFAMVHRDRPTVRGRAYAAYRTQEGRALEDFATWEVLAERMAEPGAPPQTAWWTWPEPLRDPRSSAVARFREEQREAVDFRAWLQFELNRQLGEAAESARTWGCRLGLYQDLAVGSSRASADVWMARGDYARGVHVGAPPDDYAPEGQDWGLPPLDPHRLRAGAYRSWSRLLRAVFAHAGALRIDHAMGLMRLFWIPEGRPGSEGAYVAYPAHDLLGILALESRRQGAVVVAEDLGTVPPELPALLEEWGLLRSAVMHFERDESGAYRPSNHYPPRALATFGTHDLPPLGDWWRGDDLALSRRLGRLDSEEAWQEALERRAAERRALCERLHAAGLLASPDAQPDAAELTALVHAFLAATPSILAAASLDDLAGETGPVNVPGVPLELYRSWSRRMRTRVDALFQEPAIRRALAPLLERSDRPSPNR